MNKGKEIVDFFVKSGSSITSKLVGAAIGTAIAGPTGVVVGVLGETAIEKNIERLGEEVKNRLLSKRESVKIGATMTYAIEKISRNFSDKKKIREDGFFTDDVTDRSSADEIFEGIILTAQREHEEKKLVYYGNLLANIAFDESVSKEQANQLIKISNALTYRQLCLLRIIAVGESLPLRKSDFRGQGVSGYPFISVLNEIMDLYNMGLINCGGEIIFGLTDVNPSQLKIQGIGALVYNLMELWTIQPTEFADILSYLIQVH